jgi:hypothetical protein
VPRKSNLKIANSIELRHWLRCLNYVLVSLLNLFLQIAGAAMICLCLAHFYLARLLDWKNDLKSLKPINQQVFFAHTMFLTIGMAMLGFVCFSIQLS